MAVIESWDLYFQDIEQNPNNGCVTQIFKCIKNIENNKTKDKTKENYFVENFELNIELLHKIPTIKTSILSLSKIIKLKKLIQFTEISLNCVKAAISEILYKETQLLKKFDIQIITLNELPKNHFDSKFFINKFSEITAEKIENFISITGTVVKSGSKKIKIKRPVYKCLKCQQFIYKRVIEKGMDQCFCKVKKLELCLEKTEIDDFQEIKIQEFDNSSPNFLDVYLKNDLVGKNSPGDSIFISGIIKPELDNVGTYKLILQANCVTKINKTETNKNKIESTKVDDFKLFKKISKTEHLMSHLTKAIFPNIVGYPDILQGLILSVFGGTRKFTGASKIRSDIHVLLIGDPGLGKSKILLDMINVLPKSRYVCGTLTTAAGLTVSLTYENGDFVAEAGALVTSDGGICAIDEFDKMNTTNILESMEDQTVTVAKGGVVCTIPSRTTIIAAANPKFGRFDKKIKNKKIENCIKFEKNLISRFDLVFVLKDTEESIKKNLFRKIRQDAVDLIDESTLSMRKLNNEAVKLTENEVKKIVKNQAKNFEEFTESNSNEKSLEISDDSISMEFDSSEKKPKLITNENDFLDDFIENINVNKKLDEVFEAAQDENYLKNVTTEYTKQDLTKYIIYARDSIKPCLTKEAKTKISEFFNSIKELNCTLRSLESLVRLTEARAKMFLRSEATGKDAEFVIKIFQKTLSFEEQKSEKTVKNAKFVDLIRENAKKQFSMKELEEMYKNSKCNLPLSVILERLNNQGVIIKKGKDLFYIVG